MALHVLFPGTFDPPTLGHVDCALRAAALFSQVTIAVADHPTKNPLFSAEERLELMRDSLSAAGTQRPGAGRIEVVRHSGLVVQACEEYGCDAILRGARSGSDFEYESRMAAMNRQLAERVDTLVIGTDPALAHISSTLVRQIARMGGDASPFVPDPVAAALARKSGRAD